MDIKINIIKKLIQKKSLKEKDLELIKRKAAKESKEIIPSNVSLLKAYHEISFSEKEKISKQTKRVFNEKRDKEIISLFKTRPIRSLSGIVNVSVLTKPYPCPGKCIFCPNQPGMPKSYLDSEPAAMRAAMNCFDPVKQTQVRLSALAMTGHPVDKIELRIIGGTWSFYPKKYQKDFVKKCIDVCNSKKSRNIEQAQKLNEKAKHRIVGMSIETRPDFISNKEIQWLRSLGVTAVELGVQSTSEEVLIKTKRGGTVSDTIKATKKLKDAGFKVCYQMMPNLPGSTIIDDENEFKKLFETSFFQPDHLKIYPTVTIKGTELYSMWKNKEYFPYNDLELKNLLKNIKKNIPEYVRIQRLIRDIPSQEIEAGTKISNLRQIIKEESIKEGWTCQCIRCREVKENYSAKEKIYFSRKDYQASDGTEVFLSYKNKKKDKLYSILRLRNPSIKSGFLEQYGIIRELHTYGQQIKITEEGNSPQHKGLGKKLIKEAENITKKEFKKNKIAVIASVGTRDYYRKQGYRLYKTYMIKNLK